MNEAVLLRDDTIRLTVRDSSLVAPVLERLVSAAAVQAELPVDRLVNALAAVDALASATERIFADRESLEFVLLIEPGRLELRVESLGDGQVDRLLEATRLPGIGDVLERVAESVSTHSLDDGSALTIAFV